MAPNIKDKDKGVSSFLLDGEEAEILVPKKEVLYDGYFYDVTNFIGILQTPIENPRVSDYLIYFVLRLQNAILEAM